jgi:hypothetical protein
MCIFYKIELVRMEAEFYRDDNGRIWLSYATKILVEDVNLGEIDEKLAVQSISLVTTGKKINEEAEKDNEIAVSRNAFENLTDKSMRIASDMSMYYEDIKAKAGINDLLMQEKEDVVTNAAFARLRP